MKLEGSLDAFSLPDIFQLLSFTKKSGGLHLASDGCDGVVFFSGGQVTGASADGSRQPLARRLIGAGAVGDEALAAAVQTATHGESVGVVKALLEQGSIEGELLRQAVTDQSVDAVFDLLRWQQGDFAFVVEEVNPDDVGVTLSIEPVKRPRTPSSDVVPLPVTLTNHGSGVIRVRYRDFSLTDGAGQRSLALLPSELRDQKVSSPLLPEGSIASGQSRSGSLYFHLPTAFVRPIGLRVDLEAPDGTALGQTIVPL